MSTIFYSNGHFLVYSKEEALFLREKRILGQLIGCCPKNAHQIATSSYPYLLNHYAVFAILSNNLATFKEFVHKSEVSIEENDLKFENMLSQLKSTAETEFMNKRLDELKKRNIEPNPQRIGSFNPSKLKLTISEKPEASLSSFELRTMSDLDVKNKLDLQESKLSVYMDLYHKGFYISSGMKFGSDFLAYFGDPVRYHAQYAVRVISSKGGHITLKEVDHNELNALNRLCHTSNKIVLLATVYKDINNFTKIKYWTLKPREILEQNSSDMFIPLEPSITSSDLVASKRNFSNTSLNDEDDYVTKYIKL